MRLHALLAIHDECEHHVCSIVGWGAPRLLGWLFVFMGMSFAGCVRTSVRDETDPQRTLARVQPTPEWASLEPSLSDEFEEAKVSRVPEEVMDSPPRARFVGWLIEPPEGASSETTLTPLPGVDDPSWTFEPGEVTNDVGVWPSIVSIESQASSELIFRDRAAVVLDIPTLIVRALTHSLQQKQLEVRPSEMRQLISAEYGAFDPAAFVATQFDVQNLQQRLEDNRVAVGMRKKHQYGGTLELNETLGVQNNLAPFVLPDQGLASLNIIYTQELLRDAGKDIALSRGLIATYQYDQSFEKNVAISNELIQKTVDAYWQLYRARVNFFIQSALTEKATELVQKIEERSLLVERSLNTLEQARALRLETQADLVACQTKVLQLQDVLYRLVNDPDLDPRCFELVTAEKAMNQFLELDPMQELSIAFQNRPEVKERLAAIRENAVALHVSLNQLLPRLSVALRSSLNGFENDRDYWGALSNLSDRPVSGAAIANMEVTLNNRTARAKNKEAQLRGVRLALEYEDQLQAIRQDVLVALRVVNNATPEIQLRERTLEAREREIEAIAERVRLNPDEGVSMILQLDQLFQSIHRLVRTQQQLIESKVSLQTSLVALQRAKGMLVSSDVIPRDSEIPIPWPGAALREQIEDHRSIKQQARDRVISEPIPGRGATVPH